MEMVSWLAYQTRDCSGKLRQWWQLAAAMERVKRWELAQIESNKKKDKIKLTPILVDPREFYCNITPIMFARFVCDFLSFCAYEFLEKYETREPMETIL